MLRDIEKNSPLKGHWQQKISSFYIKVFNLNSQNIAVWGCKNACHVCDVMCWVKWSELNCGRTVLQYCCCLIAILLFNNWLHGKSLWKSVIGKGSTRVRNDRNAMFLPAHDVTVIIFATFKMCYKHFHSTKLLHSAYLSKIFWNKRYLFFVANVL